MEQPGQNCAGIDRINATAADGSGGVGRWRLKGLEAPTALAGAALLKASLLEPGLRWTSEGIIKPLPKFEIILFSNRCIFNDLCMISKALS